MIEAAHIVGATSSAGVVAAGTTAGGQPEGSDFAKTLKASLHEDAGLDATGNGAEHHAGEVGAHGKTKSQAHDAKGDHKTTKAATGDDEVQTGEAVVSGAASVAPVVTTQTVSVEPAGHTAMIAASADGEGKAAVPAGQKKSYAAFVAQGTGPVADAPVMVDASAAEAAKLVVASQTSGLLSGASAKAAASASSDVTAVQAVQSVALQGNATHAGVKASGQHVQAASGRADADSATTMDEARVFEASTGALEVGVANGTHGWLRVRAELDEGGAVVAQVTAASAAAAEGLHKEVPVISAYLAEQQVGVSSLVVHAMQATAGAQDASVGAGSSTNAGDGTAGSNSGGREGARQEGTWLGGVEELPFATMGLGFGGSAAGLSAGILNGGWLSVRV